MGSLFVCRKVTKSGLNQAAMLEHGGNSTIHLNLN